MCRHNFETELVSFSFGVDAFTGPFVSIHLLGKDEEDEMGDDLVFDQSDRGSMVMPAVWEDDGFWPRSRLQEGQRQALEVVDKHCDAFRAKGRRWFTPERISNLAADFGIGLLPKHVYHCWGCSAGDGHVVSLSD